MTNPPDTHAHEMGRRASELTSPEHPFVDCDLSNNLSERQGTFTPSTTPESNFHPPVVMTTEPTASAIRSARQQELTKALSDKLRANTSLFRRLAAGETQEEIDRSVREAAIRNKRMMLRAPFNPHHKWNKRAKPPLNRAPKSDNGGSRD